MENLKNLRKLNNKTQLELANHLNIAKSTYCGYEIGTSEPTLDTLCKLADLYSVSLDYLVGREFNNQFGYMSDDEKLLIATYRKLSTYNQAKLVGEASGMLLTQN